MSRWLTEGRALGASLRRFTCIVVAGPDRTATAEVALGIAESQSAERRVVLADLLDDAARFASLRVDDDHHGIVDTLHYGVSLNRIARPVSANERLLFAPTGSEITDYGELLAHPRWSGLVESFANSKDLLVVAAPADANGLDDLVRRADGLVIVDGQIPARVDPERVVAHVRGAPAPPLPTVKRTSSAVVPAGAAAVLASPGAIRRPPPPTPAPVRPSVKVQIPLPAPVVVGKSAGKPIPGLNRGMVVGSLVTLAVALFVYWLAERPAAEPQTPVQVAGVEQARTRGKNGVDPNLADPNDSGAAAWAVQVMTSNTQTAAILKLQELGSRLPGVTYAPVTTPQGTQWFRVLAGASRTVAGAESLLASIRSGGLLDSTEGVVVHVPYSVKLDSVPASATVNEYLAQLKVGRSLPVYPLMQDNGLVWVMVGAFDTPSQANAYAETLREVGLTPQVVRRHGRTL
jgi:hypothetical protein